MMDVAAFRAAMNIGGTRVEPFAADLLLSQVTELFERRTNRLWAARTGVVDVWQPEPRDETFFCAGWPVQMNTGIAVGIWSHEALESFGGNSTGTIVTAFPSPAVPIVFPTPANGTIWALGPNLYRMNWTRGEFKLNHGWYRWGLDFIHGWDHHREIVLSYNSGLLPSQIPADVQLALVTQARFMYTRLSSTKIDLSSASVAKSGSSSYMAADLHPMFRECIRVHRRRTYGNNA